MVNFYTTPFSVELAQYEIFHAKVLPSSKDGVRKIFNTSK